MTTTTRFPIRWDSATKAPIVDGQTLDPSSGSVIPFRGGTTYSGPPAVHVDDDGCFRTLRFPDSPSLDHILIRIARLAAMGMFSVQSITGTRFGANVMVLSVATEGEFGAEWERERKRACEIKDWREWETKTWSKEVARRVEEVRDWRTWKAERSGQE